jgi:predicted RNA-binding Zn ribbon-like protein
MAPRVKKPDELAFRFVSGHRALDLVSTLGDRHRTPVERLREPADLDRWLAASGLTVDDHATARDLTNAHTLRETISSIARAVVAGDKPRATDIGELNGWARRPPLAPQLDRSLQRGWAGERPVQAALALVARETVELLTSPERGLIRECAAAPTCSLLYLDRSHGRRRRWCEMDRCGSRAKMTSYRQRRSASTTH